MQPPYPGKPHRLERIFAKYDPPIYFVTFCTWQRHAVLAHAAVKEAVDGFAERNMDRGSAIGFYVIMPDHVHLFFSIGGDHRLSTTVRLLKRSLSTALLVRGVAEPHWQSGFFDRLLRSDESYSEKWNYVRENPVRAGLVTEAEEWPFQGEPVRIDRV